MNTNNFRIISRAIAIIIIACSLLPTFFAIGIAERVYGDVNDDGKVNIEDILCVRDYIFKPEPMDGLSEEETLLRCDVNGDEKVNINDILRIRDVIFGIYIPQSPTNLPGTSDGFTSPPISLPTPSNDVTLSPLITPVPSDDDMLQPSQESTPMPTLKPTPTPTPTPKRRITLEEIIEIIEKYPSYSFDYLKELKILDEIKAIHGMPDKTLGSGEIKYEFWLNDEGTKIIYYNSGKYKYYHIKEYGEYWMLNSDNWIESRTLWPEKYAGWLVTPPPSP